MNKLFRCIKKIFQINEFKELFITNLNNHAPLKIKFLRTNHANFVSKELTKGIVLRITNTMLGYKYYTEKFEESRLLYK